jgi:hypothetical protein
VRGHPVPRKDSERSCIYVLEVSVLLLSVFFLVDFGTVSTVKHFFFIVLSITILYRLDCSHYLSECSITGKKIFSEFHILNL